MQQERGNRVLGRLGARELTREEVERASSGGAQHTNVISVNPITHQLDGDGA
jgi:hypothetical protein